MSSTLAGMLACLGATLSYALAVVFGKRFSRLGLCQLGVTLCQLSASTLIMLGVPSVAVGTGGTTLSPAPPAVVILAAAALALIGAGLVAMYGRLPARIRQKVAVH